MPAYWYENPSMSVMLLKRCPAKYHLLHSHWHKVKRQKYIILYNIADIMLLTNVYPDSHPLIPILFDFFHLYNNQRRKRLHYLFRILEFIHIQKTRTLPHNPCKINAGKNAENTDAAFPNAVTTFTCIM